MKRNSVVRTLGLVTAAGLMILSMAYASTEGEIRVAVAEKGNEVLNPLLNVNAGKAYMKPLYDYMIGTDPDGGLSTKTGAAESWKLSSDGKTFTMKIRSGIKFHNGDDLTAEDVKFSLVTFLSKRSVMSHAGFLRGIIENAETDITVPDPMTVVIRLKVPSLVLPNYLSRQLGNEGMVIPKKHIEKVGMDAFATRPVGSGPYKFLERQLGSYIKYEAAGQHWNVGTPKYKHLTIYIVNEESTRIAMLKTKQVDVIEISRDKAREVPGFDVYEKKDALIVGFFGDQLWDKTTYMSNEKFRTALSISINRKEIQDFVFAGRGTLIGAGPSYGSFALDYKPLPPIAYDPERAKQLLKEAYPGQTPTITINTDPGALPENIRLAEAVGGYWRKVGIDVKIAPIEHATWGALAQKKDPRLRNTTYLYRQGNRLLWDGSFESLFHSKGRYTSVMDPQLDALIDALPRARDAEALGKQMRDVAVYLQEHSIQLPLITVGDLFAVDPKKITQWPNVSSPMAYDLFLDDLFVSK